MPVGVRRDSWDSFLTPVTHAAREALSFVSPVDRLTRVRVGEALKDEFGDEAFDAFDDWYSGHDRYTTGEARSAWRSFGRGGEASCRIGTLIWEAKGGGWRPTRAHQAQYTNEEAAQRDRERAARREAQRLAEEAANKAAAEKAAKLWAEAVPATEHPYLTRKQIQPHVARVLPEWVKEWTDLDSGEITTKRIRNALVIPIWSAPGRLSSLQAILPNSNNPLKRDKDYLSDGRKHGCYALLGRITPDTHTILVGEGFSTCASAHEATGYPTMVAFDAGNLEAVARSVRDKMPGAVLVLLADNDAYTTRPNGDPYNPGVEAAKKAADAVRGIMVVPEGGSSSVWRKLARAPGPIGPWTNG